MSNEQLREALQRIQYKAVSLADAQVIALEALASQTASPAAAPAAPSQEPVPFDQWSSSPYTQVLQETIKDLSQKLASMTQSQPVRGMPDVATWLWFRFVDYCRKQSMTPRHQKGLFAIVHDLRTMLASTTPPVHAAAQPVTLTDEPWYGHKFKEVTRGVWHCECGKTVNEGATPCTNGTQSISTMRRDAVNVDATEMHDAGSAAHAGQGKFTRVDGSRSSLRGSGTQDDPFVADNLDDLAAAHTSPLQEPVTLTDRQFDLICQAIDKADTITMDGDYMMDSGDCIAVVRVMQALFDIAAQREKQGGA